MSGQLALVMSEEVLVAAAVWEALPSERQVELTRRLARLLARLMERWRWLAWLGLAIIAFVALQMIYDGSVQVIDTTLR